MSKSIDEAIKELEAQIAESQNALKVLYKLVGKKEVEVKVENIIVDLQPVISANAFPSNSRTDSQVMWLFDNVFNKGQKYSTIQKKFNELLGSEKNIYNVCRSLKKMGHLATVQYNKQNKLSFWGKSEWVDNLIGNDFSPAYIPSNNELPFRIFDRKILTDEEEKGEDVKQEHNKNDNLHDLPF
jgi:hypothetical protein